MRRILAAAAALSMIAGGTAAAAQTAAPLSVASSARAGASVEDANAMQGNGWIIPVALVAALVLFALLVSDDDDNFPNSP